MSKLKYIAYLLINLLVWFITFLFKKDEKLLVIGGWFGKRFADNSKYLFLMTLLDKRKRIRAVWITRSKYIYNELRKRNIPVCYRWSLRSIYYHIRAKYHVVDQSSKEDINGILSYNSIRINLWHGFPLKKIGTFEHKTSEKSFFHVLKKRLKKLDILSAGGWRKKYILATSEFAGRILGKAFETSNIIITDYPRTCALFSDQFEAYLLDDEKELLKKVEAYLMSGKNIIAYFPTFRDKYPTLFLGITREEDIKSFVKFLKENNLILITKYHFAERSLYFLSDQSLRSIEDMFDEAIIILKEHVDIYPFLKRTSILITDYSSVYFDFLLLDRPIIFYPYDLEKYTKYDRGLIFDYDTFTPGDKVYSIQELEEKILYNLKNPHNFKHERAEIRKLIFKNRIPRCERILSDILSAK